MDNMNFDNGNRLHEANSEDMEPNGHLNSGMNVDEMDGFNEENSEQRGYEQQKRGYINIQNVPVKKSRFKKVVPFIASTLISAIVGGAAGAAYMNYAIGRNAYTSPMSPNTNQDQAKLVGYTPSNNLITNIAETVGPSIVGISTKGVAQGFFGETTVQKGTGSGIIFDERGYIVTNQHVIDGSKEITVNLPGRREGFTAQVVGSDARSDLAILKINANNLPTAAFGDSSKLRVGDLAVAIGNPLGEEYAGSVTSGIISALNRSMDINDGDYYRRYKLIQTDAAINPGNSGGALINQNGQIIGINTIKYIDNMVEGMGFAIPINEAKPIIEQLMKNGYVSRPFLGVEVGTVTQEWAKQNNCPLGAGIDKVIPGGAAEAAGLLPGDVIIEIDGTRVESSNNLIEELEKQKVGDSINIKIWRDGETLTIPATLGEMSNRAS